MGKRANGLLGEGVRCSHGLLEMSNRIYRLLYESNLAHDGPSRWCLKTNAYSF